MGPCLRRHRNRRLGRKRRCDNGNVVADQIGSHLRQTIIVPVGPAVFDRDVLAFDKASFARPNGDRGKYRQLPNRRSLYPTRLGPLLIKWKT